MVEEARLESVYTPKGYRGFESPFLRSIPPENRWDFFVYSPYWAYPSESRLFPPLCPDRCSNFERNTDK